MLSVIVGTPVAGIAEMKFPLTHSHASGIALCAMKILQQMCGATPAFFGDKIQCFQSLKSL